MFLKSTMLPDTLCSYICCSCMQLHTCYTSITHCKVTHTYPHTQKVPGLKVKVLYMWHGVQSTVAFSDLLENLALHIKSIDVWENWTQCSTVVPYSCHWRLHTQGTHQCFCHFGLTTHQGPALAEPATQERYKNNIPIQLFQTFSFLSFYPYSFI